MGPVRSRRRGRSPRRRRPPGSLFGLGTAACWSVSPLLIRVGLDRLPNPTLGVTISMFGATIP
jgi:hypothetical protein